MAGWSSEEPGVFSEDVGDVATAGVMGSHAVCIFERATESLDQNLAC